MSPNREVRVRVDATPAVDDLVGTLPAEVVLSNDGDVLLLDPAALAGRRTLDVEVLAPGDGILVDGEVLYAADEAQAAQAWVLLKSRGYPAVYTLGGGLPAWKAAGLPLQTGAVAPREPGRFTLRPALATTVDRAAVLEATIAWYLGWPLVVLAWVVLAVLAGRAVAWWRCAATDPPPWLLPAAASAGRSSWVAAEARSISRAGSSGVRARAWVAAARARA